MLMFCFKLDILSRIRANLTTLFFSKNYYFSNRKIENVLRRFSHLLFHLLFIRSVVFSILYCYIHAPTSHYIRLRRSTSGVESIEACKCRMVGTWLRAPCDRN